MSVDRESTDPAVSNEVVRAMGNELKRLREEHAAVGVSRNSHSWYGKGTRN